MRIKTASAVLVGVLTLVTGVGCGGDDAPTGAEPTPAAGGSPAPDQPDDGTAPAPAAFNQDSATGTFDCDGQDVTVNGAGADLELLGECGTVVVNGEGAVVLVEDAQMIVVNGAGARVSYGGDPQVVVNGEDATADPA